jgi:hypothetical protein
MIAMLFQLHHHRDSDHLDRTQQTDPALSRAVADQKQPCNCLICPLLPYTVDPVGDSVFLQHIPVYFPEYD